MTDTKTESEEKYCFSLLYGSGIYEETGGWTGAISGMSAGSESRAGDISPVFRNHITGETFYARKFECKKKYLRHYQDLVRASLDRSVILWPSDLIELGREWAESCTLRVENEYSERRREPLEQDRSYAVLFPSGEEPDAATLGQVWDSARERSWKNPRIRTLVRGIVQLFEDLNRSGYQYHDIHLSRFLVEGERVRLDFSRLMFPIRNTGNPVESILRRPMEREYPIEFAEPAYVLGEIKKLDFDSQNYSLCALLFYLCFGRYAYDGRLMAGYSDDSEMNHYAKFRDYHRVPVFIFDQEDDRNKLGLFEEEQETVQLWDELPEELRRMFREVLCERNARRSTRVNNPAPDQWLDCLDRIGW